MTDGLPAPGPRGDFLLGSVLDFKEHPAHFIRYVASAYGDVARFKLGPQHWYVLSHPEDIHEAMGRKAEIFIKPRVAARLWDKFLGQSLLSTEGDEWKRLHRLARPAFHRNRILAYGEVMVDYTHRMLDSWEAGSELDLDAAMVGVTLEIVAKTLFDTDIQAGGKATIGDAMTVLQEEMLHHIHMPVPVPKWWPSEGNKRKLKAIKDIEDIVLAFVAERRRTQEDHGDLLSMLLLTEGEDGERLTDKELRDMAMTLIFAGHETTAHSMTHAWYLLGRNPQVAQRLADDIARVTGGERLTVDHLADLPYLEWVAKEALRALPAVWVFMKETTEDVVMRGYKIPKGSQVMISPLVTHADARWFPSPQTFDPDRWEKKRAARIPAGAYIPFSGGLRVCLGKAFAMMEMRLVLGSMIQRVVPTIVDGYELKQKAELSLHPDVPQPIEVVLRGPAVGA